MATTSSRAEEILNDEALAEEVWHNLMFLLII
jgi:hypothetical protein